MKHIIHTAICYSHIMPGNGKSLNESQRLDIISKLSRPNPPSKRSISRQYEVSETWINREGIHKRSALMSEEIKK